MTRRNKMNEAHYPPRRAGNDPSLHLKKTRAVRLAPRTATSARDDGASVNLPSSLFFTLPFPTLSLSCCRCPARSMFYVNPDIVTSRRIREDRLADVAAGTGAALPFARSRKVTHAAIWRLLRNKHGVMRTTQCKCYGLMGDLLIWMEGFLCYSKQISCRLDK